jgi:glycosidase
MLSPVCESPSHHGYDATNLCAVARRLGGDEALRELVRSAHARGMRVLLDFVAGHTSHLHPAFLAARADPAGPWATWYSLGDWPPHGYLCYAGVPSMPLLATDHPEVRQHLVAAALSWLGEFGVHGFRLDHVPGPSHAFWAAFQREVKRRFPDALTLGEITAPLEHIATYAGRMDAFLDFPLNTLLRAVFATRNAPLADLLRSLAERESRLTAGMARATFLDNHDMDRFLWLAGGDTARLRLAAACQLTLPGTPILYYGTEVGLAQERDAREENAYARAPMPWGDAQDAALLGWYRRLLALRRAHPALRRGRWRRLEVVDVRAERAEDGAAAEHVAQVGAYLRATPAERLVVALNNNRCAVTVRIPLAQMRQQGWPRAVDDGPVVCDFLTSRDGPAASGLADVRDGAIALALAPLGAALLTVPGSRAG